MLQLGPVTVEIVRLVEVSEQRVGIAAPGSGVRRRDAMWHVPHVFLCCRSGKHEIQTHFREMLGELPTLGFYDHTDPVPSEVLHF